MGRRPNIWNTRLSNGTVKPARLPYGYIQGTPPAPGAGGAAVLLGDWCSGGTTRNECRRFFRRWPAPHLQHQEVLELRGTSLAPVMLPWRWKTGHSTGALHRLPQVRAKLLLSS